MDSIEKVLTNIESMKDEIIQAVSSIVKIPSINPKYPGVNFDDVIGGESDANEFIAEIYSLNEMLNGVSYGIGSVGFEFVFGK